MSNPTQIGKKEILEEIEKINPVEYFRLYSYLKRIQKLKPSDKNKSENALKKLFSLEGCLSDIIQTVISPTGGQLAPTLALMRFPQLTRPRLSRGFFFGIMPIRNSAE